MRAVWALLASFLVCSMASADPTATWNDAIKQVEGLVRGKIEKDGIPSYSIAIVSRNHPTYFLSAGHADLARRITATPHTVYAIGSVTKVFTGTMLMQMRDAGRASVDDPLTKHMSEFSMPSPFTGHAAPTLRQLASHTSGLPRMIPVNSLQEPNGASVAEMTKSLGSTAAVFPPLTHYKYSNLGVDLLGYALARTARQPWSDYVDQNILHPLGMNESSAVEARLPRDKIAVGYIPSGPNGSWEPGPPMAFTPLTEASGSIMSSANDMARFLAWQLNESDTRVLSPLSRREMWSFLWMLDDWGGGSGTTWFVERLNGEIQVLHSGGTAGFSAFVAFMPGPGVGIVALTNSTDNAHGLANAILTPVLAAAKAEREKAAAAPRPLTSGARSLAGTYLHDPKSPMPPFFVKIDNGHLMMFGPMTAPTRLIPTADPKVFIAADNQDLDGETVAFEQDRLIIGHGALVYIRER